jgi:ADP-ribose pyrophosphatase YjhB (NUDIX family)
MNPQNLSLHYYQKELIKKLTLSKDPLNFNKLIIKGLTSEHMNYHLKKLISCNLVKKEKDLYTLTDLGKDYSNLLEDDVKTVEKQPKTSIIIRGIRKKDGRIEHLLDKRLRQPYYGKVGRLTGKVKFGETLKEAVSRELFEETGLKAKYIELESIYRKMRYKENGDFVQDVIFYIFLVKDFSGDFIEKTEFQENMWITAEEAKDREDIYEDLKLDDRLELKEEISFIESIKEAEGF